jgi:MFS transporter, PAT family, beta-lactamase induction signal transducer AmpG
MSASRFAAPLPPFPAALARLHRLVTVLFLGFASGLPLALTGQAMQAWLSVSGMDLATIGFLGLVGLPYTFKFLWAPLIDRFEPPFLGRRRGWLVLTQLGLAAVLLLLSGINPLAQSAGFAAIAAVVALLSASQDVVIDAYRTDLLPAEERGLGASLAVFGYRLAMIVSGGVAFIWAQQWGSWPQVYRAMAVLMLGAAGISLLAIPGLKHTPAPTHSRLGRELRGFAALLLGGGAGVVAARWLLLLGGLDPHTGDRWEQLLFLITAIALALPLGFWAARRAGFETFNESLDSYFSQQGAWAFLLLIVLYKLGDAFAGSLTTPFLIHDMGYSQAEVGIVNKLIGLWLTIVGALVGGAVMLRLRLDRALLIFGVLQLVSNFGFWWLAISGRGAWGQVTLSAFNLGVAHLDQPTPIDLMLLSAIGTENLTGGMGTAAFVALLMTLCNHRYTATHYALLSAFAAVGRIYVSPLSGVLSESIGWPAFFVFSVAAGIPGLVMVWEMRHAIRQLALRDA